MGFQWLRTCEAACDQTFKTSGEAKKYARDHSEEFTGQTLTLAHVKLRAKIEREERTIVRVRVLTPSIPPLGHDRITSELVRMVNDGESISHASRKLGLAESRGLYLAKKLGLRSRYAKSPVPLGGAEEIKP